MKRKKNDGDAARCKLAKMVIGESANIADITGEVLDQFNRLDRLERIVVVAYLQILRRGFLLVDKTQIFEFFVDTDRKVMNSDIFLLHKWLESADSKCRKTGRPQVEEEICVELFAEKIVLFKPRSSNKKRRK